MIRQHMGRKWLWKEPLLEPIIIALGSGWSGCTQEIPKKGEKQSCYFHKRGMMYFWAASDFTSHIAMRVDDFWFHQSWSSYAYQAQILFPHMGIPGLFWGSQDSAEFLVERLLLLSWTSLRMMAGSVITLPRSLWQPVQAVAEAMHISHISNYADKTASHNLRKEALFWFIVWGYSLSWRWRCEARLVRQLVTL